MGKSEFARMGAGGGGGHSKCSERHMHPLGVMKDHGMFWKLLEAHYGWSTVRAP